MDIVIRLILVFVSGGVICSVAQILIDKTKLTPARILVCYVCVGVLIFAVGLYEPLHEIFGSGISVPLIGFGAVIGKGIKEAVDTEGLIGVLKGGLTASSAGITAALLFGFLFSVFFKPKAKRM